MNGLIERHLLHRSIFSYLLYPLSLLYRKLCQYRQRQQQKRCYKSPCTIISIGNIVSGGSGKTPFCIELASALKAKGIRVGISHRGYKGNFEKKPKLISNYEKVFPIAKVAGDEALLLAKNLKGVPVAVGKDRKCAIELLCSLSPVPELIILDDSFQNHSVYHDLDFLLFDARIGLGNGFLIPAGYLREPITALQKNHIAIIKEALNIHDQHDPNSNYPDSYRHKSLQQITDRTTNVYRATTESKGFFDVKGMRIEQSELINKKILAVSGIAFPLSFEQSLMKLGLKIWQSKRYPDHYGFDDEKELHKIITLINSDPELLIICTEKDFVKLEQIPSLGERLLYLKIGLQIPELDRLLKIVLDKVKENAGKSR